MGIENLSKLEINEDGTYTVTCDNKCGTEVVTKNDVAIGAVCEKKYCDLEGSIVAIGQPFKLTVFGCGHNDWDEELEENPRNLEIKEKITIKRKTRYKHFIIQQDGEIKECLKNYTVNQLYEYVTCFPETNLRVSIKENKIKKIKYFDDDYWYHCIEGHYDDPNILKLELRKRWLKKQQAEIS